MRAQWEGIEVFTGTGSDGRFYVTDKRDCLPCDLRTFNVLYWTGVDLDGARMVTHADEVAALMAAIAQTEAAGTAVTAQIGELFYETDN